MHAKLGLPACMPDWTYLRMLGTSPVVRWVLWAFIELVPRKYLVQAVVLLVHGLGEGVHITLQATRWGGVGKRGRQACALSPHD